MSNLVKGKSIFATLEKGSARQAIINPLINSAKESGVTFLTNTTVNEIIVKDNKVLGIWLMDNNTLLNTRIKAKNVILNVPLYEAYQRLLKESMLTGDEEKYIKYLIETNSKDLSCYFILEKDAIKDLPGHFHGFDVTSGIPIYIGEIVQQKAFGAIVPEKYDYLQIYIPGGRDGGYLKYKGNPNEVSYEKLEKIKNKMLKIVDKWMVPGFKEKIVSSSITWSPNFGRYCYMAFPSNIEVKSQKVQGLYYASDTVDCTCIADLGLEKCGEVALRCIKSFNENN